MSYKHFVDKQYILDYDKENQVIDIVKEKIENNSEYTLNNFELEYVSTNLNFQAIILEQYFDIIDEDEVTRLKEKYYDFKTNRVFIHKIIGETEEYMHCLGLFGSSANDSLEFFIKHSAFQSPPARSYPEVDISKYEKLDSLKRKAYNFQKYGINFLLHQKMCLLLDDKGLGKTYQSIMAALYHGKKTLIVTLKSTKVNWLEEIEHFTTKVTIVKDGKTYPSTVRCNFVIINYALLSKHKELLQLENFDCIILDESQKVTNVKAAMTKAMDSIVTKSKPEYVWATTATPMQKVEDLIPILKFFGVHDVRNFVSQDKFREYYLDISVFDKVRIFTVNSSLIGYVDAQAIIKQSKYLKLSLRNAGEDIVYDVKKGSHFGLRIITHKFIKHYLEKFVYNTTNQFYFEITRGYGQREVHTYKPNSNDAERRIFVDEVFKLLYWDNSSNNTCTLKLHVSLNGVKCVHKINYSWFAIPSVKSVKRAHEFRQRFMKYGILRRLVDDEVVDKELPPITFKQHHVILTEEENESYDSILEEILEKYGEDKEGIELVKQLRHLMCLGQLKVPHVIEIIKKEVPSNDKFIIGTCFDNEIEALKDHYGNSVLVINGKVSAKNRQKITKELTTNPKIRGLIVNMKAGSTGLNMIGANHIYQISGHFNPTFADQLSGRVRRIGQLKDCFYTVLIVKGTEDDHVVKVNRKKDKLIDFMINHANRY